MKIPFKYGTVVSGRDFCGRKSLLDELGTYIDSCQNVVILGERRVGKTSLVSEAIRISKNSQGVFVDLMGVKSISDLARRLVKALVLSEKGSFLEKVLKQLSALRPQLSFDPATNMPTVSLGTKQEITPEGLEQVFSMIHSMGKKKKILVFLDEFQDVYKLKEKDELLALLRSKIQYQKEVTYIYAGSIRNQMEEIFSNPDSPFFKSAIPLYVEPLASSEFAPFIQRKFKSGGRIIAKEDILEIFSSVDNVTGDIQQFCEALWMESNPNDSIAAEKFFPLAFKRIFSHELKDYESKVSELTEFQFKVLKALARNDSNDKITSTSFMENNAFGNASSVKRAVDSLTAKRILFEYKNEHRFFNPFFKKWIQIKF
jgi:AAA+ ATPase superfamily predicted ATPase